MTTLSQRADALRRLAELLRAGLALRIAAKRWHEDAPEALRPALLRLAHRLELGDALGTAAAVLEDDLGDDAGTLAGVLSVHARLGGDAARMLEGLARSIDERAALERSARGASAGAALSARIVAGLPLAMLPLNTLAHAPLLDAPGIAVAIAGIVLAIGGVLWIGRLVPRPPATDEPVALLADVIAGVVRGGVDLDGALRALAAHAPQEVRERMLTAKRMTELGATWPQALARTRDPGLASLAFVLQQASSLGVPVASALEAFAARLRTARTAAFDVALRRAPVLMVVPLTVCVLPSFVLLGVVPFLRGLSLSP